MKIVGDAKSSKNMIEFVSWDFSVLFFHAQIRKETGMVFDAIYYLPKIMLKKYLE